MSALESAAPRAAPAVDRSKRLKWQKTIVFVACSLPLAKLAADALFDKLGANPISEVMNRLGFWTLTFLVGSLAITPIKTLTGFTTPLRYRRMVGLYAFAYAALHFSVYLVLDQAFDLGDIGRDIVKRKFITVGFVAFVLLIPLAVTSTDGWVKSLGFRQWKRIHRLVYVAAVLGIIHFVWRVKADLLLPAIYGSVLAFLLGVRVVEAMRRRARGGRREPVAGSR